jgi:hypothetical protein
VGEKQQEQRALTFNEDGTIDAEQLVGLPQELVDRVTDPEFVARAKEGIQREKARQSFMRGARIIKAQAQAEHQARRPDGVSGRQRKRLRRLARKSAVLGFNSKQQEGIRDAERQLPDHESSATH